MHSYRGWGVRRGAPGGPDGPWFRVHPEVAAAVIAASSLAVVVLQMVDTRASDAIALLYVLPISLAAVTYGQRGGLIAASAAYVAFGWFALFSGADHVAPEGWLTRAAAMFLLGGLLGRACDQTMQATRVALAHQRERLAVEEQNRRYAEAIELSDSILQHVAAAKWAIERDDRSQAADLLGRVLSSGQQMLGDLLPQLSGARLPSGMDAHPADAAVTPRPAEPGRSPSPPPSGPQH
ncbi:MAG TPA: hypothetical protein VFH58_15825 [Acidimicrobiales bacterium]|nr:hypothetical protein [Acidimicrobiales bacterium]